MQCVACSRAHLLRGPFIAQKSTAIFRNLSRERFTLRFPTGRRNLAPFHPFLVLPLCVFCFISIGARQASFAVEGSAHKQAPFFPHWFPIPALAFMAATLPSRTLNGSALEQVLIVDFSPSLTRCECTD